MPQQLNTLYKLMTMYTLSRVDFALTNSQISNVFLDLGYTNYFNVQYALGELVDNGLVHEEAYPDCHYYTLTESGHESIEALRSSLSVPIRSDIDSYLKKMRLEFREALSTRSEYYRMTDGDWAVRCRVMEHSTALIDLTLAVPNETQAKIVSQGWKEKSQEIYALIIRMLTQPDRVDRIVTEENPDHSPSKSSAPDLPKEGLSKTIREDSLEESAQLLPKEGLSKTIMESSLEESAQLLPKEGLSKTLRKR